MKSSPADDFTAHARRRVWFIALQAIIVVCVVVVVSAFRSESTASRTTHFVLHPNASVPPEQVPQAIDVLDGPLVQTVLRVLNSREILDRAADAADVDTDGITADATVSPSSAYFDVTVRGDDIDEVTAVSRSFTGAAAQYIEGTYGSYVLEPLGASGATERSFPPSAALLVTSALLGALVGLALVFVEWVARRAPFAAAASRTLSLLEPTRPNGTEPEKRTPGAARETSGSSADEPRTLTNTAVTQVRARSPRPVGSETSERPAP